MMSQPSTSRAAGTDAPTFAELLAKAKAQAATGHRWEPAGDNMTDTILTMMDLIPTATRDQIAELTALLAGEEATQQHAIRRSEPPVDPNPTEDAPPIAPSASPEPLPRPTEIPPSPVLEPPRLEAVPNLLPSQAIPAPGVRAAVLFARGLDAEHRGDLSAARRYYASAAQQGGAAAARNLGRLYDPAYLRHTALGGVDPDPALARRWYERAVQLGDTDAAPLLEALSVR